ncbi:MAG: hypothetical protein V1929_09495 [bacterium]
MAGRCFPALFAVIFFSVIPGANAGPSGGLYLQVKGYQWEEFEGGERLLEESGPLFGIGLRLEPDPLTFSAQGKIEVYAGEVDYDGQTISGDPLNDKTAYSGGIGEIDATVPAWVSKAKSRSFLVFAGAGGHIWQRDLGQENEDIGYTEDWFMVYGRVGVGFYLMQTGMVRGYFSSGVKIPFFTQNQVTVDTGTDIQDVDVEPDARPGPFMELGWRWKKVFAVAFYEYTKLEASEPETVIVTIPEHSGSLAYRLYQPESEVHILGVNVGMYF